MRTMDQKGVAVRMEMTFFFVRADELYVHQPRRGKAPTGPREISRESDEKRKGPEKRQERECAFYPFANHTTPKNPISLTQDLRHVQKGKGRIGSLCLYACPKVSEAEGGEMDTQTDAQCLALAISTGTNYIGIDQ